MQGYESESPLPGDLPQPDFGRRLQGTLSSSSSRASGLGEQSLGSSALQSEDVRSALQAFDREQSVRVAGDQEPRQDPWLRGDPWSRNRSENWAVNYENWSPVESGRATPDSRSESGSNGSGSSWAGTQSSNPWNSGWDEGWRTWNSWRGYDNWSLRSSWRSWETPLESARERAGHPELCGGDSESGDRLAGVSQVHKECHGDDSEQEHLVDHKDLPLPASPFSPAVPKGNADVLGRPRGHIPTGEPSIAGGSGSGATNKAEPLVGNKLSSSYPPIFYARPGESWADYWRTVQFWLASEGRTLPAEVRGPRLMQQLRERAAKIVQHLTVCEVSGENGIEIIKATMEKSPIIKILDTKKVDKRRQKFMRLGRLPSESIESFLNRAEIYRRENQSSPDYTVGSKFYIGHLLDAAKLTKRDLALLKAAAGGTLEDEEAVTVALLELADQLEGLPHCTIGKGETTLDNEDKFLVQKATGGGGTTPSSLETAKTSSYRPKRRFFNRRRVREALVAILEDDLDGGQEGQHVQEVEDLLSNMEWAEESGDEDDDEPLADGQPSPAVSKDAVGDGPEGPLLEIYAQEYKARNKVRELKKMRQYFQKDQRGGGPSSEHVQKWVKERQQTDPCFLCGKLGHWSQECPMRRRAPVHASNVTFPSSAVDGREWDVLEDFLKEQDLAQRAYMVHVSHAGGNFSEAHDVYWTMKELGNQMIVDLGCMRTVAGTSWVNQLVTSLKEQGRFVHVMKEREAFRFGDGHLSYSKFCVLVEVALATVQCVLRISVVSGNCPPLLSKNVCSHLGFVIDTEHHMVSSKKCGIKNFGLSQTSVNSVYGGHYIFPVNQFDNDMIPIKEFDIAEDPSSHAEVVIVNTAADRAQASDSPRSSAHGHSSGGGFELSTSGATVRHGSGMGRARPGVSGLGPGDHVRHEAGVEVVAQNKKSKPVIGKMARRQNTQMRTAGKLVKSSAAASTPTQTPEQVAAMAMEIAQKLLEQQKASHVEVDPEDQNAEQQGSRPSSSKLQPARSKAQKKAALTGSEAPFPTLSKEFSDDITFNLMLSLNAQALTFKWKLLLVMMRAKRAVEAEKTLRWKRNPRWIMGLHGRHMAALWGHLGAGRQLCHNPKTWWLADGVEKDDQAKTMGSGSRRHHRR